MVTHSCTPTRGSVGANGAGMRDRAQTTSAIEGSTGRPPLSARGSVYADGWRSARISNKPRENALDTFSRRRL